MKSLFYVVFTMVLLVGCNSTTESSSDLNTSANTGLIGSWTWDYRSVDNQDTSYVWTDLYGQLIFTEKQFSFIAVSQSGPRDTIPVMTRKQRFETFTKDELYDILGKVASRSGTYKVENDTIWLFTEVSLWPNLMAKDAPPTYWKMPTIVTKDTLGWGKGNIWLRMK